MAMIRVVLALGLVVVAGGCDDSSSGSGAPAEVLARAMAHEAPPKQVVLARNCENPRSSAYVLMPERFHVAKSSVRRAPGSWIRLARELQKRDVPEWTPVVFMHARQATAASEKRLVVLELEVRFTGDGFWTPGPEFWVVASVVGRDAQGAPVLLHVDKKALNLGMMQGSLVYAGQPDPADPSHFTVSLGTGGFCKQVDGWLEKDDTVRLQKS